MKKMNFKSLSLAVIASIAFAASTQAQSTLDINSASTDARVVIAPNSSAFPSPIEGIIIPRVNRFPSTAPATTAQGMFMYLQNAYTTTATPPPGATASTTYPIGFYYWTGATGSPASTWLPLSSGSANIYNTDGTLTGTRTVTQAGNAIGFIGGNVGIGTITPTASLDINGAARIRTVPSGTVTDSVLTVDGSGNLHLRTVSDIGSNADLRLVGTRSHITKDAGTGSNGTGTGVGGDNIGIGSSTLNSGTSGTGNIAIGTSSLATNTVGNENIAIGKSALQNASGINNGLNIAIGTSALANNTAFANVGVGYSALNSNTSGTYNIACGTQVLAANVTGNQNTGIGYQALYVSTGNNNTGLGNFAGKALKAGDNNLAIGASVDLPSATGSNQMNIGNYIYGLNMNSTSGVIGIGYQFTNPSTSYTLDVSGTIHAAQSVYADNNVEAVNQVKAAGVVLTSDVRLKKNIVPVEGALSDVMKLKAVSYLKKETIASTNYNHNEMGFIAQDLRKVFPQLVIEGTGSDKVLAVNYIAIIPVLTKGIQEQQAEITSKDAKIADLETRLAKLEAAVELLKK